MKKAHLILFIYLCGGATSLRAQEWVRITPTFDPSGAHNPIYSYVSFVDSKNGWMVSGPKATVWRTRDGGNLWKSLGDNIALERIEFVDTLHGWIFGASGPDSKYNLLITKDGGLNWNAHSIPPFMCVKFLDSLNGYAGGDDTIYATTDGGVSWVPQEIVPYTRCGINDILFIDKNKGWAVGASGDLTDAGIILNTNDAGKHWNVVVHPSEYAFKVYFTDTLNGFILGSAWGGTIRVTSDGGISWHTNNLPCPPLYDLAFANASMGWAIGQGGYIWKTIDKGLNWSKVESGTTSMLRRIFVFDSGQLGYILGDSAILLKYNKTVDVMEKVASLEPSFHLLQNYPNPFNPATSIEYLIPSWAFVSLKVFDLLGRTVAILVNQIENKGSHYVNFDGSSLPSGIYLYQLQASNFIAVKKFVLLK